MSAILAVTLCALAMILVERLRPGRAWPQVSGWSWRALAFTAAQALIVLWAGSWFRQAPPAGAALASAASVGGEALIGYLALTFVYYWWHRARHEIGLLWRWLHQLHHSARRIEIVTSFYKHPLEIAANTVLSSLILYAVVGIGPEAASLVVLFSGLAELFYHWNVRTPHWLGYLIQRPEMHCVHHQGGGRACNYADLPLWDLLFGTYENPREFRAACGFSAADEARVPEMLIGRDVLERAP
ncbi:MAG TPA: sterol desaturase family protein [Solimonas sp.]|nr:sterol desaturase family protein [Solimonas sp.]